MKTFHPTPDTISSNVSHIFDKNYDIDEKKTIYIGESIIKTRDYYTRKKYHAQLTASKDFTFDAVLAVHFNKGDKFNSAGNITQNGNEYTVMPINKTFLGSKLAILVKEDGTISTSAAIIRDGEVSVNDTANATISPSDAKMTRDYDEIVDSRKGYINHELIFNGVDKNTLTVTYREYTPEDIARSSFFQTLTYRDDSEVIRYKKYKILVHHVDSESMTYSVLEDPES
jgi:hypothetical protein